MPLNPQDAAAIAVGKCYVNPKGQVRRVLELTATHVVYESRGKEIPKGPLHRDRCKRTTFIKAVVREVPCHHNADIAEMQG
ncbi:hypothetical protein LRS73_16635 [Methylobacterium currus]|uniref:hypothetical protein n=1 Tax=Methylobacterium currus TaxID=2051553 RepID=UPI001E64615A|nr:hypothetical protein [Methylobacterium currus]UHC14203.1 hypothetical protein LRS73_16635 [Methylobacterium currus]